MCLRVIFLFSPHFSPCSLRLLTAGCGSSPSGGSASSSSRSYSGTASGGDFMNITLDSTAQTITYSNVSNGDSGVVPYTVNPDGTYMLNDPAGNLVTAYEIPGYAMLLEALKDRGPTTPLRH